MSETALESSFELMLWRTSLAEAPFVPGEQDLVEWADLLRDNGQPWAAGLLCDVAAIQRGFPPQIADVDVGAPRASLPWTISLGIAELTELAAAFSPSLIAPSKPRVSGHPDNEAGIGPASPRLGCPGDVAGDARRLLAILADPVSPRDAEAAEAARLLDQFVEADRRLPAFDYRNLREAPLDRLVVAIALAALIDFSLRTRDLATAPTGSIGMLHRTARLQREGLGPYLSAVGLLARESRDIYELAGQACPTGSDAYEAWIYLLSRGCHGPLFCEVVDDLGDKGRSRLLGAVLERTVSQRAAAVDQPLVARIRDAALDNADGTLAIAAQSAIVRLRPHASSERKLLGMIMATAGDFAGAEAIFGPLLAEQPDDLELRAALHAARHNDASGLAILHGFTTPADRQEYRLHRRGVAASHRPRRGDRVSAVDVS